MLHAEEYADIDPAESDEAIAAVLTVALLKTKPRIFPYRLAINHDVRAAACKTDKPRTGRCPLNYEWSLKAEVGIETKDWGAAYDWVKRALLAGYTVTRYYSPIGQFEDSENIASARRRAEYARRPRTAADDEIPF